MIRDTLIGLILLACLGIANMILGDTGTLVASACCATGFLAREVWDRRRRELADRRSLAIMNRNRERIGMAPFDSGTKGLPPRPAPPPPARPRGPENQVDRQGMFHR